MRQCLIVAADGCIDQEPALSSRDTGHCRIGSGLHFPRELTLQPLDRFHPLAHARQLVSQGRDYITKMPLPVKIAFVVEVLVFNGACADGPEADSTEDKKIGTDSVPILKNQVITREFTKSKKEKARKARTQK